METAAAQALSACRVHEDTDRIVLSKKGLAGLHPALLNRVLRTSIKTLKRNLDRISLVHMDNMVAFCFSGTGGKSLDLPGRIRIYKTRKTIEIKKEKQDLRQLGKARKALKHPPEK
jgi:tRNA(Ile)-lysidine synthase